MIGLARFLQAERAEWSGDYRAALAFCDQAIAIGRRLRLPQLVIWPTWFRGKAACCLGEYGRAIGELEASVELCDRIGDRAWKTRILNTLGWCFAEFGSARRAQAFNAAAAALAHEIGDPEIIANAEINLAANVADAGDLDRAEAYLEPILAANGRFSEPFQRWRYLMHATDARARVALARRDPARAATLAAEELAAARRHRAPKVEARALALSARALLDLERREEADAAVREALHVARAIGYPRGVWGGLKLLAGIHARAGARQDAARCAAEAAAVVDTLARSLPDADLVRDLHASAAG
jgi:tetratricopeptide (TPR) repeat protein